MKNKRLASKDSLLTDVKPLLHNDSAFSAATRLNMVYLVAQGLSSRQVAKIYNVSFKHVTNWVHRFEKHGLPGLYDLSGRGRKPILSISDLEIIRSMVINQCPTELGYPHKRWSGKLLILWINKNFKTQYSDSQAYKLFVKMGLKFERKIGFKKSSCVLI